MNYLFEKDSKLLPKEENEYRHANNLIINTMKSYKSNLKLISKENEKLSMEIKDIENEIDELTLVQNDLIKTQNDSNNISNPKNTNNIENTNKNHTHLKKIFNEILKEIIIQTNKGEFTIKVIHNDKFNLIEFDNKNSENDFTIIDLKYKLVASYNSRVEDILITDQYNNILHDKLELYKLFYPFKKFDFKDHYPEVYLKYILNLDQGQIITKMDNLTKSIKSEKEELLVEFKKNFEKKKNNNKEITKTVVKHIEKKKKENQINCKNLIFEYSKKFGKIVQTTLLILFYILIFNKNTYSRKGLQNLSIIEDYFNIISNKSKIGEGLNIVNFTNLVYDEFKKTSWYQNNQYLKYASMFQKRNDLVACSIPNYLQNNFTFNQKCVNEDYEDINPYGKDLNFKYKTYKSEDFSSYGRNFGNLNGFYLYFDLNEYSKSKEIINNEIKNNNWVDIQTQFVGYIFNFYDSQDQLAFNFIIYYDLKFKDFLLSNSYLNFSIFSLYNLQFVDYFFLCWLLIFNLINFILTLKEMISIKNKDFIDTKKKINKFKIEVNRFNIFNKAVIIYEINFFQIISILISFNKYNYDYI